ncbi:hypothetical protein [Halogeometricum borinquense]|uniref:hypothetical protein n=1 Tax=Halogeometricum borinquense TaxID=60847 RepID=UPI0034208C83
MALLTRRRLLHGTVALVLGTAGCNGQNSSTEGTAVEGGRPKDRVVPEHYELRNPVNEPPIWLPNETETGQTTSDEPQKRPLVYELIASTEKADRLKFADIEGVDEAQQFVNETDFDSETLFIQTRSIESCHTLSLCNVSWSDADIHADYGSTYRDVDVRCEVDTKDSVSMLIRIPEVLDPDTVTSHGSSWRSSGCHRRVHPDDRTTTEPPNFGPKTAGDGSTTDAATENATEESTQ